MAERATSAINEPRALHCLHSRGLGLGSGSAQVSRTESTVSKSAGSIRPHRRRRPMRGSLKIFIWNVFIHNCSGWGIIVLCALHLSLKNLKVYFGCPIVCSWAETKAKEMEHQSTKHRCTTRCYTSGKIWVLKLSPSAWMSMTRPTDIAFLSRLRILPRIKLQNFQWKISASSPWHDDPVGVRCRPYARHFCPNNFGEVGGRRKKSGSHKSRNMTGGARWDWERETKSFLKELAL